MLCVSPGLWKHVNKSLNQNIIQHTSLHIQIINGAHASKKKAKIQTQTIKILVINKKKLHGAQSQCEEILCKTNFVEQQTEFKRKIR